MYVHACVNVCKIMDMFFGIIVSVLSIHSFFSINVVRRILRLFFNTPIRR